MPIVDVWCNAIEVPAVADVVVLQASSATSLVVQGSRRKEHQSRHKAVHDVNAAHKRNNPTLFCMPLPPTARRHVVRATKLVPMLARQGRGAAAVLRALRTSRYDARLENQSLN